MLTRSPHIYILLLLHLIMPSIQDSITQSSVNASTSDVDADTVLINYDDIRNYNASQVLPEPTEVILNIRSWLQPTEYNDSDSEYQKHLLAHVPGTGTWLTSTDIYQEWLHGKGHDILWIKGIPGSGKSVMAANLIDQLTVSHPHQPVLFFFFRNIIDANNNPRALLRDWLDQLLAYSPPLQVQLRSYLETSRSIESISVEDMWNHLRNAISSIAGTVFFIVDALDEMDETSLGASEFIKALADFHHWNPGNAKLLVTSRPTPKIQGTLTRANFPQIRLQETLVDVDIAVYVQHMLETSTINRSDWPAIKQAIPGKANGLFLYAKLAMDLFLNSETDVNSVLLRLPYGLNAIYANLLRHHAQRSGIAADVQYLILQAVTHATRPLRLLELAELVRSVNPTSSNSALDKNLIRIACGPLLEILPDETVSVVHHSLTEYLKGETQSSLSLSAEDSNVYNIHLLQPGPTHHQLAIACLRYLQSGCLDIFEVDTHDRASSQYNQWSHNHMNDPQNGIPREVARLNLKYPFLDYAARNWHHHVIRSEAAGHNQAEMIVEIENFLSDWNKMNNWLHFTWPSAIEDVSRITHLHIASRLGLVSYTKHLLQTRPKLLNEVEYLKVEDLRLLPQTPLWWAAFNGHTKVVKQLIDSGAKSDSDSAIDNHQSSPLHIAASNNHHEVIVALLETGIDPSTGMINKEKEIQPIAAANNNNNSERKQQYSTPIMNAAQRGHVESVKVLLSYIQQDMATVHHTLAWAASFGRSKVVAAIIAHPVDVDLNLKVAGTTPLFLACNAFEVATIRILLEAGADPTIMNDAVDDRLYRPWADVDVDSSKSFNALHVMCDLGSWRSGIGKAKPEDIQIVFSLLIEAGVDVNQRTHTGQTALHGAVSITVLTRLLVEAGADVNAVDNTGHAPIHMNLRTFESMRILVEQGNADINLARRSDGWTPLMCLIEGAEPEMVLKFLEYKPNINAISKWGNSVLHQRSYYPESISITKALLERGADANLKNIQGQAPLHVFGPYSSELVATLVAGGADINGRDGRGRTLLWTLLYTAHWHKNCLDLIGRGGSVFAVDFKGRTVLHEIVRLLRSTSTFDSIKSVIDFFIELGVSVHAVDYRGNGLLHELAISMNHSPTTIALSELFISLGLDMQQKNYAGRMPLHLLSSISVPREAQNYNSFLDFVIAQTKDTDLDIRDNCGITPLHMAVAAGMEFSVKRLLDAGANPLVFTNQGLTPLHIASRNRQPNIVGLLLDAIKRRQQQETNDTAVDAVNARTLAQSITPLIYACKSGRPETVALLLAAGADVKLGQIFRECVDFENEDKLWQTRIPLDDNDAHNWEWDIPAGLILDDTNQKRPQIKRISNRGPWNQLSDDQTARLDEILDMLADYGADISQLHSTEKGLGAIGFATHYHREYTISTLRDFRSARGGDTIQKFGHPLEFVSTEMLLSKWDASLNVVKGLPAPATHQPLMLHFLARREYYLIEQLARQGVDFLTAPSPASYDISNLAILVKHGFVSLVKKIGTIILKEKKQWHAFGDMTKAGLWFSGRNISQFHDNSRNPIPLIIEAVSRELPNLDMVRLLVEQFHIDINEMTYGETLQDRQLVKGFLNSALHVVAGGHHWWQIHQALPYLLKSGAKVNSTNCRGETPLHMAAIAGLYSTDAAEMLIAVGADVNAIDNSGSSILMNAHRNQKLVNLLITHGAAPNEVTREMIITAIDKNSLEMLKVLLRLDEGVDLNIRLPVPAPTDKDKVLLDRELLGGSVDEHEILPLALAAHRSINHYGGSPVISMQIMELMLHHGADPFAKYLKKQNAIFLHTPDSGLRMENKLMSSAEDTPSILVSKRFEECTVAHEAFLQDRPVQPFLSLPNLDTSHRDAKGRTLLLATCQSKHFRPFYWEVPTLRNNFDQLLDRVVMLRQLIDHGADLQVHDIYGRNCIHGILQDNYVQLEATMKESLEYIIQRAPHLINEADNIGRTPLHYAMERAVVTRNMEVVQFLLSNKADPLAITKDGNNLIHVLAQFLGHESMINCLQDLVMRGVHINGRNALGETPLFAFYRRSDEVSNSRFYGSQDPEGDKQRDIEAAKVLQEMGADFLVRDGQGHSLLHIAAASGDTVRFQQLIDMGLDITLEDDEQKTALDIATALGKGDIVLAALSLKDV